MSTPQETMLVYGPLIEQWVEMNDDINSLDSSSDSPADSRGTQPPKTFSPGQDIDAKPHIRIHKACDVCRIRNIKCDLGPVDNPCEPPCVGCRRTNSKCTFAPTRKGKRKTKNEEIEHSDAEIKRVRIQQPEHIDRATATEEEDHSAAGTRPHENLREYLWNDGNQVLQESVGGDVGFLYNCTMFDNLEGYDLDNGYRKGFNDGVVWSS